MIELHLQSIPESYHPEIGKGLSDRIAALRRSNPAPLMSALGQKQTFRKVQSMSALPPIVDIESQPPNVRFVHSFTCPLPVDKPSATSNPLIAASGDAHLGAVSPDALLVSGGPADVRARTVATGSLRQPGFAQAVFVSGEIFRATKR